jgi:glycopeptide antibiotics resistance protein
VISIELLYFFPIPLLIGLLILGLVISYCRKRGWFYLLGLALMGFYLLAVIGILFFPIPVPENWPTNLTWGDTLLSLSQVNLIPFNYGSMFLHSTSFYTSFRDIIGNILLTIPFGFGICFLIPLRNKQVLLTAVGVGLTLEGIQLLMKLILGVFFHSVDINDVLMNALGVLVGAGLYRAVKWISHNIQENTTGPIRRN